LPLQFCGEVLMAGKGASLFAGTLVGALVATTALPLGFQPVELALTFAVLLFAYSVSSLLYFTAVGWPHRSLRFNFYDFNRIVMTVVLSGLAVSFFAALTMKMS